MPTPELASILPKRLNISIVRMRVDALDLTFSRLHILVCPAPMSPTCDNARRIQLIELLRQCDRFMDNGRVSGYDFWA